MDKDTFLSYFFFADPLSMSPQKALETIGANLQKQYERWQPRARYKQSLDPTVEEVKKLCTSLRRNAKEERVLFHYNGHGVPKPTSNGEVWVFNRVSICIHMCSAPNRGSTYY
jgi:regulator-associated protein of mTOR